MSWVDSAANATLPVSRRLLQARLADDSVCTMAGGCTTDQKQPPPPSLELEPVEQLIARERVAGQQGLRALLPAMRSLRELAQQGAFADPELLDGAVAAQTDGWSDAAAAAAAARRRLQMLVLGGDGSFQPIANASSSSPDSGAAATAALEALTLPPRPGPGGDAALDGAEAEGEEGAFGVAGESSSAGSIPVVEPVTGAVGPAAAGQPAGPLAPSGAIIVTTTANGTQAAAAAARPRKPINVPRGFKSRSGGPPAAGVAAAPPGPRWHAGAFGREVPARGFGSSVASALVSQRVGRGKVMYVDADGNELDPAAAVAAAAGGGSGGAGQGAEQVVAFAAGRTLLQAGDSEVQGGPPADQPDDVVPAGAIAAAALAAGAGGRGASDLTQAFKRLQGPRTIIAGPHREEEAAAGSPAKQAGPSPSSDAAGGPELRRRRRGRSLQMLIIGEDGGLQPLMSTGTAGDAAATAALDALAAPARPPGTAGPGEEESDPVSDLGIVNESGAMTTAAAAVAPASGPAVEVPAGFKGTSGSGGGGGGGGGGCGNATDGSPAPWQPGTYGSAVPEGGFTGDQASELLRQRMGWDRLAAPGAGGGAPAGGAVAGDSAAPGGYGGHEQLIAYSASGGAVRRRILQGADGAHLFEAPHGGGWEGNRQAATASASSRPAAAAAGTPSSKPQAPHITPQRRRPLSASTGRQLQQAAPLVVVTVKVAGFASSMEAQVASRTLTDVVSNGTLAETLNNQGWAAAGVTLVSLVTGSVTSLPADGGGPLGVGGPMRRSLLIAAFVIAGVVVILLVVAVVVLRARRAAAAQRAAAAAAAASLPPPRFDSGGGSPYQQPCSKSAYAPGYYPPAHDPSLVTYPSLGADGVTHISILGPAAAASAGATHATLQPQLHPPPPAAGYPPVRQPGRAESPVGQPSPLQPPPLQPPQPPFQHAPRASAPPALYPAVPPHGSSGGGGGPAPAYPAPALLSGGFAGGPAGGAEEPPRRPLASGSSSPRGSLRGAGGGSAGGAFGVPGFPADRGPFGRQSGFGI
jgi:hypothetical protein